MSRPGDDMPTQLRVYAIGLRGENDLKVGPHMAALKLEEAALALDQTELRLQSLIDSLREAHGALLKAADGIGLCSGSCNFNGSLEAIRTALKNMSALGVSDGV